VWYGVYTYVYVYVTNVCGMSGVYVWCVHVCGIQLTEAQLANHNHSIAANGSVGFDVSSVDSGFVTSPGALPSSFVGGDAAHDNVTPSLVVNYIIKT